MNRHLKIAFFMAPLLALGTYYLTGLYMEPKVSAKQQQKLLLLGECLPRANACVFALGDLELKLISNEQKQQLQLAIISNRTVQDLSLALGDDSTYKQFPMMKSDNGKYWQISLTDNDNLLNYKQLRMALTYQENTYFAESAVTF